MRRSRFGRFVAFVPLLAAAVPLRAETVSFRDPASIQRAIQTVADMNEWNKEHRCGWAYIDKDGDPCLEMDVDLDGMSTALFQDHVDIWDGIAGSFRKVVLPQ